MPVVVVEPTVITEPILSVESEVAVTVTSLFDIINIWSLTGDISLEAGVIVIFTVLPVIAVGANVDKLINPLV